MSSHELDGRPDEKMQVRAGGGFTGSRTNVKPFDPVQVGLGRASNGRSLQPGVRRIVVGEAGLVTATRFPDEVVIVLGHFTYLPMV